jgi:hypothetical protein
MAFRFDRRVSTALFDQLTAGGCFAGLLGLRAEWAGRADLQLRASRQPGCHASFYVGLTSVLDVYEAKGRFALRAHRTHRGAGGFDPEWASYGGAFDWVERWPLVEDYLRRLVAGGKIDRRWLDKEGVVQAVVAAGNCRRDHPCAD